MIVVFDTNAYRRFVGGKTVEEALAEIRSIKDIQNKKEIISLMSATVAEELLCHLFDGGFFFPERDCTKAIRVLYAHCGDTFSYGMIPYPVVQISKDLFGRPDTISIENQKIIGQICFDLFKNPTEEVVNKHRQNIMIIKNHNAETENAMAEFLRELAIQWRLDKRSNEEKSASVRFMTALAFIIETAKRVGINFKESIDIDDLMNQFKDVVEMYMRQYPAPLKMRENLVKKLADPNFIPDKPERVNQVWDEQILHVASQTYGSDPIVLVTGDRAMKVAAEETASTQVTPFKGNVATLEEYIEWLKN